MEYWKIVIALCCGAAVAQSLFLGGYLIVKDRARSQTLMWLSIVLIALAARIGKSIFYYLFPNIYLIGVVLGAAGLWMIGPSFLFYLRASKIKRAEYFHFFPVLVVLLTGPVFGMQFLVPAYHIGAAALGLYLLSGLVVIYKNDWNGKKKGIVLVGISLCVIWLTFVFQYFSPTIEWYALSGAVACLVLYVINFYIIGDQDLFKIPKLSSTVVLSNEVAQSLSRELEKLFGHRKIYRRKGLTVGMVANELDRPKYLVSKVINQQYGLKFNEFVNKYRVEEVKEKLRDLESNPKVEAIAVDVGFSSTSSLYHAFKKETQLTLRQYRMRAGNAEL